MSANDLVSLITDAVFVLVFLVTVARALRDRRRTSLEAALFFGAIAWILMAERARDFGVRSPVITDISLALLMVAPYLLLRLVHELVGVSSRVLTGALVGLVAAVLAVFVLPPQLPIAALVALVAYFGGLMLYAAALLMRGTVGTSGSARQRIRAAALGTVLLALAIVALGVEQLVPDFDPVTRVLVILSGLAYLAAFATPAPLKRAWVDSEFRAFIVRISAISPQASLPAIASEIESEVSKATGGRAVVALGTDAEATRGIAGAPTAISAPLVARGRHYGMLVVDFRSELLFPEDDRALVALFADQSALVIDGARLYQDVSTINRALEQATQAKSDFLASMSHELRTPLNAVLGFADLLVEQLREHLGPTQKRYFQNITDAGNHLLELINEVLDTSRVEAGRLELHPEVITVGAALEPVLASARTEAAKRGITFDADIPADRQIRVDAGRLRQILYNLVSNATKFTEAEGRVVLTATLEGSDLLVEVSDTGVGIPPELHGRVFGSFERLHESSSFVSGTGLGLSLTKRLVELHGGSISFESAPGKGTTFRVRLPNMAADPMTGRRLLIVDDERRDAELIAALATAAGLPSEVVRTASAARSALRRDLPTAVVLDLRLPDDRGERLLEDIKAQPATSAIPVIVVTVEDDDGRSRAMGAEDHLTKPIAAERLSAWLRRVAEPRRVTGSARDATSR